MVTLAQAQETDATVPADNELFVDAEPLAGDTHATTEAHADDHGGVFPPFDPATFPSQLLWLAITFGALYLLMSRIALPQIGSILADRRARIDADLAAAEADRQKTDAAIAAYEQALAGARSRAQTIANETRDANLAEQTAARQAEEARLAERVAAAEEQIAANKSAALSNIDEIAASTAEAVVSQLMGGASPDAARAAVAKAKE